MLRLRDVFRRGVCVKELPEQLAIIGFRFSRQDRRRNTTRSTAVHALWDSRAFAPPGSWYVLGYGSSAKSVSLLSKVALAWKADCSSNIRQIYTALCIVHCSLWCVTESQLLSADQSKHFEPETSSGLSKLRERKKNHSSLATGPDAAFCKV